MWPLTWTTFWGAIAASVGSLACQKLSKRKKPILAIVLGAFCGTSIVVASNMLPDRIKFLHRSLRPESAIEGAWIQIHHDPEKIRYATVTVRFNPSSSMFELKGSTYSVSDGDKGLVISKRSDWSSLSMTVRPQAGSFQAYYGYSAKIVQNSVTPVEGFGTLSFDVRQDMSSNHGAGYYLDTQTKPPVSFEMRRIRDSVLGLFTDNPGELIRRYHSSPEEISCPP